MFEITPNTHPLTVHFPIALAIAAVALALLGLTGRGSWRREGWVAARWSLTAAAVSVPVVWITGFIAYDTVPHDAASHAVMTVHRNWALGAGTLILAAAFAAWTAFFTARRCWKHATLALAVVAAVAVSVTGWYGGKLVFEHGVGVERLPDPDDHHHHDGDHRHEDHGHGDREHEESHRDDREGHQEDDHHGNGHEHDHHHNRSNGDVGDADPASGEAHRHE